MKSTTRASRHARRPVRALRSKNERRTSLLAELLEPRLLLAQTTGLFFNEPEAAAGYVLFAPNTSDTTFLIDKQGTVVNTWESEHLPGLLGYLLPDGILIREEAPHGQSGNGFINAVGAGGVFERFDWEGNKIWEFAYDSPQYLAHHDFDIMPNGNLLIIAWEYRSEAEATQAGRDPSLPGAGYLYPDKIVEVEPDYENGGGTVVWEWKVWDHLVQEFDPTKSNYYGATGVETNPQLIDINYVSTFSPGGGQAEDWTHANGIDYNAELDQILLSVREFNEIWIIDHSTTTEEAAGHSGGTYGRGGDLLYRWGNPQAYDRGIEADRKLFYQHDARWIPPGEVGAGNITILNNGLGRPGTDFTSVEEITPPILPNGTYSLSPGAAYGPATTAWTYNGPVANFSAIISGAIRLPNGNTLITYGTLGNMTEVTSSGEEVWKYVNPFAGNQMLGPETPIPSLGVNDPLLGTLLVNFVFQAQHYGLHDIEPLIPQVVGRKLFYNNSKFDGNNLAINTQDDAAIASDKSAYLASDGLSTFSNVSAYSRGINGVMIDVKNLPGTISLDDFAFRTGGNNQLASWTAAPAPAAVSVRPGAGEGGSDRIVITWTDGAIKNTWLEVSLLATEDTGLGSPDTFYFGSRLGDSGINSPTLVAVTSAFDDLGPRNNSAVSQPVTNVYDYDKNGAVSAGDSLIARNNGGLLNMLNLGVLAGPLADDSGLDAVALALGIHPPTTAIPNTSAEPRYVRSEPEFRPLKMPIAQFVDAALVDESLGAAVTAFEEPSDDGSSWGELLGDLA